MPQFAKQNFYGPVIDDAPDHLVRLTSRRCLLLELSVISFECSARMFSITSTGRTVCTISNPYAGQPHRVVWSMVGMLSLDFTAKQHILGRCYM